MSTMCDVVIGCCCFSICVYGGGDRNKQIQTVKKGVEIIIGK